MCRTLFFYLISLFQVFAGFLQIRGKKFFKDRVKLGKFMLSRGSHFEEKSGKIEMI